MEEAHGHHIPCGTVCVAAILSAWVEGGKVVDCSLGSTESALQAVSYLPNKTAQTTLAPWGRFS